jgi:hypothetical protein
VAELEPSVVDLAWVDRDDQTAALLLATDKGLYEVALLPGAVPLQILVDPANAGRGFYAVRAFVSEHGAVGVAAAAQTRYGLYLSTTGGRSGSFTNVGLTGVDTRALAVQYDGPATVLWVGAGEPDPNKPGRGCYRARLFEADVRWEALSTSWVGGTCWDLSFAGSTAVAATQSGGALQMDAAAPTPQWQSPTVNSGLPLRDRTRFEPVESVATGVGGQVLAGTARGVYRATDQTSWASAAAREKREVITIPQTWLLCSGEHDIEVVRDHASLGD